MSFSPKAVAFKLFLAALTGSAAALSPLTAALAQPREVEITAFGEFGPARGDMVNAPNTAKGTVRRVVTNRLLRRTDCVTARLGTRLGILVRHTRQDIGYLPVEIEVRHPPITSPDGRTMTSESWPMQLSDQPLYTGWHFGESYELVPGPYSIAVMSQEQIVAQKNFTVVLPGSSCARSS